MKLPCTLRKFVLLLVLSAAASRSVHAQTDWVERFGVTPLDPEHRAVEFQQLMFDYQSGRITNTDWGRVRLKARKLLRVTKSCEGYVNVFVPNAAGALSWVVDNVFVVGAQKEKCSGADLEGLEEARLDDPFPTKSRRRKSPSSLPVDKYLDLRPGQRGDGRMDSIRAVVWFSRSPVPNADEVLELAHSAPPVEYRVRPAFENAEGDLTGASFRDHGGPRFAGTAAAVPDFVSRERAEPSKLAIGPPPQAIVTRPLKLLKHVRLSVGTFQAASPNVNSARNQCVPAAHANALAYLEARYNYNPNIWNLPHHHVRGVGRIASIGDITFYEPYPRWSVVANVDFFTQRTGVFDLDTGGGTGGCKNFLGLLKYLYFVRGDAPTGQVRHQGAGNGVIGDNAGCDNGLVNIGGLQSLPEGVAPTWEWMRSQLQAGRSLVIGWGRYNDEGEWTGGHKVRVYGAAAYNGKKYLYMLDDSNQGNNFDGLRTFSFEVTDFHTPGAAGVPNGVLEIDGMANRQIVNAISVEPNPKYLFE